MEKTTKAAKCPKCGQYHLIASIESFNRDKGTRKEFSEMMNDGFEIIEVSTKDARNNFGYCPQPVQSSIKF